MMTLFQNYGDGGCGGGDDEHHDVALSKICVWQWFTVSIDGFTVFLKKINI